MAPVRWFYLAMGTTFVGLGIVGAVLPLMPSTIFFILALFAFKKSSPTLERRLLEHPRIGPTLSDWDANRSIRRKTKLFAIGLIWACLILSIFFMKTIWGKGLLVALGLGLTLYIATRREPVAAS